MVDLKIQVLSLGNGSESSIIHNALRILRPHLPVSIPIYRRLQFGSFSSTTFLLTNLESLGRDPKDEDAQWFIAFLDRTRRPETEMWMFASWESDVHTSTDVDASQEELMLSLANTMKSLPIPPSVHQDVLKAEVSKLQDATAQVKDGVGISRADYAGHILDPNIMLCAAIHEQTANVLQRCGLVAERFKAGSVPNHTYIFDVDTLTHAGEPSESGYLPDGLRWGVMESAMHFELVRNRTGIPRQDRTLAALPSLAIFQESDSGDESKPIAWAFVGLDACLTSLHVEPEWRGKGLAKLVTAKLFREKMDQFWEEGLVRQAHGYVTAGNAASCAVCERLGGKSDWNVFWVRMDLGRVDGSIGEL
jgi:GNAT superfamily N-acetyltransferase